MSDENRWFLNQPGYIDWKDTTPSLLLLPLLKPPKLVEWDGTYNMPVLPLSDKLHEQAKYSWSL